MEQTAKCRDQRQVSRHSNVEIGAVILEQQETIEHIDAKSLLLTFFFSRNKAAKIAKRDETATISPTSEVR